MFLITQQVDKSKIIFYGCIISGAFQIFADF